MLARRRHRLLAAALVAASLAPAAALGGEAKPAHVIKVKAGMIADSIAFSPKGDRLAYAHTDLASFLKLVVVATGSFERKLEIPVADTGRIPVWLRFSADGERLLYAWMEGYTGVQSVTLYDAASGKALRTVGPATIARLLRYRGQQVLSMATLKSDRRRGSTTVAVRLYAAATLKPLRRGSARVLVRADRTLKRPPLRLLYWERGRVSLMGMRRGKYDRARDVRLPDEGVRYDVVARRTLWSQVPKALVAWTRAIDMRPAHPEQYRFLHVSDDLKTLWHVGRENDLAKVTTPVPWRLYEPRSLAQRETWDGRLYFSLTIDPVNPDAVRRKKADPDRVDIYALGDDLTPVRIGSVVANKRRFAWAVGEGYFAFLRKLKGFGRGGRTLEIYHRR